MVVTSKSIRLSPCEDRGSRLENRGGGNGRPPVIAIKRISYSLPEAL